MSGRKKAPEVELKLNLSPPSRRVESPMVSPTTSCLSSELNQQDGYSTSPKATSMMLVGCPRCLMYVMLAEEDPRCPKCKSTVLLDVIHHSTNPKKKIMNIVTTTTTSTNKLYGACP